MDQWNAVRRYSVFCSRECWTVYLLTVQVRYTGYRDRPLGERRLCLQSECREGHAPIVSGRHIKSNQIKVLCDKNKTKVNHMQLHFQSDSESVLCDLRTVLWSFLCTLNVDVKAKIPRKHFPRIILVTSSRGCRRVGRVGEDVTRMLRGNYSRGISA